MEVDRGRGVVWRWTKAEVWCGCGQRLRWGVEVDKGRGVMWRWTKAEVWCGCGQRLRWGVEVDKGKRWTEANTDGSSRRCFEGK